MQRVPGFLKRVVFTGPEKLGLFGFSIGWPHFWTPRSTPKRLTPSRAVVGEQTWQLNRALKHIKLEPLRGQSSCSSCSKETKKEKPCSHFEAGGWCSPIFLIHQIPSSHSPCPFRPKKKSPKPKSPKAQAPRQGPHQGPRQHRAFADFAVRVGWVGVRFVVGQEAVGEASPWEQSAPRPPETRKVSQGLV